MKKIVKALSILLVMILLANSFVFAAEPSNQKDLKFPAAYICEGQGGKTEWNSTTSTATFKVGSSTLVVNLKNNTITSNGKTSKLDKAISGGRLMLPLSQINSAFGLKLTSDDCLKIIGTKFIKMLQSDQASECSALFSKSFSKYMTAGILTLVSSSAKAITFDLEKANVGKSSLHQNLIIPCILQQTDYTYILRFDYDGKINEISCVPPKPDLYEKPAYDKPENYTEEQVIIGEGEWKLPGTLTLPKGKGPFPAVILVHGSGPEDRDETIGAVKPFRDLAVGLASMNIAVLRYEKRSLEHSTKSQLMGNFTMKEEFEEDAVAAAQYLKSNNLIDSSNIIIIGHSQGGYVLPRIMGNDKDGLFKAGIIMSSCSRPIYEVGIDQNEYFIKRGLATQADLDLLKAQISILKSPDFNPAQPPKEYILGTPYYYDDMTKYDVKGIAASINKPMLIMQGEKDFQVFVQTDYEGWKKAFISNSLAEFKLYPELNHVYTNVYVDGMISDYYVKANIPQYVIDDIGNFVNKVAGNK